MGFNTIVPTVAAAASYPAATYNTYLAGGLNGIQSAWTAYTPVWTSTGTAPVVNNGVILGKYRQIGKTIDFAINFTPGSTTTFGTGNYSFSLPAGLPVVTDGIGHLGVVQLIISAGARWDGQALLSSAATTLLPFLSSSTTDPRLVQMTPTSPATFNSGAILRVSGRYETA